MIFKKRKLLWLDDKRDPKEYKSEWTRLSPFGSKIEVYWVRTFEEFRQWILENQLPDAISFDNDLGEERPDGYQCALWLLDYCVDYQVSLPVWSSHHSDVAGKENIDQLFKSFLKNIDFD